MKHKFAFLVLSILFPSLLVSLNPAAVYAIDNDTGQNISDPNYNIDSYLNDFSYKFDPHDNDPIVGVSKTKSNNKFVAFDQGLSAFNYLLYADQLDDFNLKKELVDKSLSILKFSTSYLVNSYLREKDGIIEYWDTQLEGDSLAKVTKNAKDQAILLLAIDKAMNYLEDEQYGYSNKLYLSYNSSFYSIWQFLDSLYDDTNAGWYSKATALNQSQFSIDTTKRTYDNLLIIFALSDLSHLSNLGISNSTISKKTADTLTFLRTEFKVTNSSISSFGNKDGSFINVNSLNAKENSLYGYINTLMFQKTGENIYLVEAKNSWQFLVDNFWEIGFGGLFATINPDYDPIIAGKPLEDQLFFSLLSLNLASLDPSNSQYLSYWLTMNELISINYVKNYRVASSTDLRFNPSSEYFARSSLFYYYYLLQIPHIIALKASSDVIIGSQAELEIRSLLTPNLEINLTIESKAFDDNYNSYFDNQFFTTNLAFRPDLTVGSEQFSLAVIVDYTIIQSFQFSINFLANIKIPNGLIYLGGALILALLIIVIRRPPEIVKKYIENLNRFQLTSNPNNEDDTE